VGDQTDDEILLLIRTAADDGSRAMLMVLYQINKNLVRNTDLTSDTALRLQKHETAFSEHRQDFQSHVVDEKVVMAQGFAAAKTASVAWKGLSAVLSCMVVLGAYILSGHLSELRSAQQENVTQSIELHKMQATVDVLQSVVDRNSKIIMDRLVPESHPQPLMGIKTR